MRIKALVAASAAVLVLAACGKAPEEKAETAPATDAVEAAGTAEEAALTVDQAAKDAEEEAKAVTVARQSAEKAQFEAWRDGLSPDELADAMRGHPGGPKDAWLRSVWKKSNSI